MCGGIDPHSLTLWDWQAITWNWNDRHAPDEKGGDKPRPDPDMVRKSLAERKRVTAPSIAPDTPA